MKQYKLSVVILLMLATSVMAQDGVWSFGVVGSHHKNHNSSLRLSEMDNPTGMGVFAGYSINEYLTFGLTGHRFSGDIENGMGEATLFRSSASAYLFPIQWKRFRPFISAGMIYTRQELDYNIGNEKTDHLLQMRHGLGLDVALFPGVSISGELAVFSDGLNFIGSTRSVGIRYSL